jgi:hypothetical protein
MPEALVAGITVVDPLLHYKTANSATDSAVQGLEHCATDYVTPDQCYRGLREKIITERKAKLQKQRLVKGGESR